MTKIVTSLKSNYKFDFKKIKHAIYVINFVYFYNLENRHRILSHPQIELYTQKGLKFEIIK